MVEFSPQQLLVINELDQQVLFEPNGSETNLWNVLSYPDSKDLITGASPLIPKKDAIWFATTDGQLANYQKNTEAISRFEVNKRFEKFNFISDQEVALVDKDFTLYVYDLAQKELRMTVQGILSGPTEVAVDNDTTVSANHTRQISSGA